MQESESPRIFPDPLPVPRAAWLWVLFALVSVLSGCGGDEPTVSLRDLQQPDPVEDVAARPGDRRVRITWTASSETDILGYEVLRATSNSGPFELIGATGTTGPTFFQDLGPDLNSDGIPDGLVNGQKYFYKVLPFDRRGRRPTVEQVDTVDAVPGALPQGVNDLAVSGVKAYGGDRRTILTWTLNLDPQVFGYFVYRSQISTQQAFERVALVPQGTNHFVDDGVSNDQEFVYEVSPATRELLEGRRLRSRIVRTSEGDDTVPKFPGHDLATGPVQVVNVSTAGVTLSWGRPTENSDGTLIGSNGTSDDLIQGGYIVYRSRKADGRYFPVGIVEGGGNALTTTFTDPRGTSADFYTIRAFDRVGTLSAQSRRVNAGPAPVVPDVVRGVDAFASTSRGQILVQWTLEPTATAGYRVYRSEDLDRGFRPVSGVLAPAVNFFTDSSLDLTVGRTFFYKVAGVALDAGGGILEGNASVAAPATPGPTDGVFFLEAENATVIAASNNADFDAADRVGFHAPFSANGALFIDPSAVAAPGVSFLTLQWTKEIDSAGGGVGARTYDVFISTVRNSNAGIFDLVASALSTPPAVTIIDTFTVQGRDFFSDQFGTPALPTIEFLGQLTFPDNDPIGGSPVDEVITLGLTYQGFNPGLSAGNGNLFFDSLILVRR